MNGFPQACAPTCASLRSLGLTPFAVQFALCVISTSFFENLAQPFPEKYQTASTHQPSPRLGAASQQARTGTTLLPFINVYP
jgi:hypothetical protein